MKYLLLPILCLAALAYAEEKYASANDEIDLSEVLGNERLLSSYSKCLLNKGPCTPEVKNLKDKLPEVLETRCAKCTDKQKQIGKQLVDEIRSKHPEIWSELAAYYDPEGKFKQSLEEFLKS